MKIVVNKSPRLKIIGKTFEDMEAWDILRSMRHVAVDDKRHTITLECRVTGDRIEFRCDVDALKVPPATFYRVIAGWDEHDLFMYALKFLGRRLTWEEKDLVLAQAMRFGDQVNQQTFSQVFGYCVAVACQESLCAKCKKTYPLTFSEVSDLVQSDTIPPKWLCQTCRKSNEQKTETEEVAGVAPEQSGRVSQRPDDPDGHGGDHAETPDKGVVLE